MFSYQAPWEIHMVIKYTTVPEEWSPRCDHIPIITVLKTSSEVSIEEPRTNSRATNWDIVIEELAL